MTSCSEKIIRGVTERAKLAKKVHKPPLLVNVMEFELNGFNASIWVPWTSSDPKKLSCLDRNFQTHKICGKKQDAF